MNRIGRLAAAAWRNRAWWLTTLVVGGLLIAGVKLLTARSTGSPFRYGQF
jgi:hypothetical protein